MAITLDPTPGSSAANSFLSLEEGNAFAEEHPYSSLWVDETDEERLKAVLVTATRLLSAWLEGEGRIKGMRTYPSQRLSLPRTGLTIGGQPLDSTANPFEAKYAAFLLALGLLAEDKSKEKLQAIEGLTELKADVITLKFKDDIPFSGGISGEIRAQIPREWLRDSGTAEIFLKAM